MGTVRPEGFQQQERVEENGVACKVYIFPILAMLVLGLPLRVLSETSFRWPGLRRKVRCRRARKGSIDGQPHPPAGGAQETRNGGPGGWANDETRRALFAIPHPITSFGGGLFATSVKSLPPAWLEPVFENWTVWRSLEEGRCPET
ncbi:hypothetical protein VTJ04DRAFT_3740 [Mycothermus thermophilus]|uniref:uncharacterized protein n=1 Tax=Humicola insolens TaxID=85995 RepID=UPI00374399B1